MMSGMFLGALTAALWGCGEKGDTGAEGDSGLPPGDFPALSAVRGEHGAVIWAAEDVGEGVVLERNNGEGWFEIGAGGAAWYSDDGAQGTGYRLSDGAAVGDVVRAEALSVALSSEGEGALLLGGDALPLSFALTGAGEAPGLALAVSREVDGEARYYTAGCEDGEGCWGSAPVSWLAVDGDGAVSGEVVLDAAAPAISEITAWLVMEAEGAIWPVAAASVSAVELGRAVAWGDLHAHTNLSYDGCELPDADCADRGDVPAEDFIQNALDIELDYVALTDHAEWATYYPGGSEDGQGFSIWSEQLDVVSAVDDAALIAMPGYEWTWSSGEPSPDEPFQGGHKSVFFQDTDVCAAYRVSGGTSLDSYTKGESGGLTVAGNDYEAQGPQALWAAFDAAAEICGREEVIAFFHHPAYIYPQAVDWSQASNASDPRFETLVEIYSEHGSSECLDLEADHCSWSLKTSSEYEERGAVQSALARGWRLGFTAGTDSHDGRPGSVADMQPSCTANFSDTDGDGIVDTPRCHDYTGGLTGVLHQGALTREGLFAGLRARNTLATSGPRAPLRVAALGADGAVYLPGDDLPQSAMPATLQWALDEALAEVDASLAAVDVIDAGGQVLEVLEQGSGSLGLDLAPGELAYLRVRVIWQEDEHRLWVSPFFAGEETR
jgi:hypothetical protein